MKFLVLTSVCACAFLAQLSAGSSPSQNEASAEKKKETEMQNDEQKGMSQLFLIDMQNNGMKKDDMNDDETESDDNAGQMSILLVGSSPSDSTQKEAPKKDCDGDKKMDKMGDDQTQMSLLMC